MHRDLGYLAVGLTFVYALSGLAVNHVEDWDPNFTHIETTVPLAAPLDADDGRAAQAVLAQLGIEETPSDVFRSAPDELLITLEHQSLTVDGAAETIAVVGQSPRFLLRAANWLHLNRGKKAWTFIADAYAAGLLLLATSGLFMLPGRKGIAGRGALLALAGAAVPVLYVTLSGGP
jgi:hypothetical protein